MIRRAPDEPSSDTPSSRIERCSRGPLPLSQLPRFARPVPGAPVVRHAFACSHRPGSPPPAGARLVDPSAFHRIGPHCAVRERAFPLGRGPRVFVPASRWTGSRRSTDLRILRRSSASMSFARFPLQRRPRSGRHPLRGVAEARSRARPEWDRARRRPRFVPTDVCNPRDCFSTTSTLASAHSKPPVPTRLGNDRFTRSFAGTFRTDARAALSSAFASSVVSLTSPFRVAPRVCGTSRHSREARTVELSSGTPRERSLPGLALETPFTLHPFSLAGRRVVRLQARQIGLADEVASEERRASAVFQPTLGCLSRGSDP